MSRFTPLPALAADTIPMSSAPPQRAPITRERVLRAAAQLGALGPDRESVPRLLAALCDAATDARTIAQLVGRDPSISARVLRVANSPYYGQTRTVATIDRACLLLGTDAVRGIAAAACLDRTMSRTAEGSIRASALMDHSLATAVAAEALARDLHPRCAGEAFIGGLLHNLGVPIQLRIDPQGVAAMSALAHGAPDLDIRALEARCASIGHEECAALVFEAWGLPQALVDAARHHHDPFTAQTPYCELAGIEHLAARIALASGHAFGLESAPRDPPDEAMQRLGFEPGRLDALVAEVPRRTQELRNALRLAN